MTPKPRIALIATRVKHKTRSDTYEIPRAYLDAVLRAEGCPCCCPPACQARNFPGCWRARAFCFPAEATCTARYGEPSVWIHSSTPNATLSSALIRRRCRRINPLLAILPG